MGTLDGKVALVTGAGSGLGRGSAIRLAAAGASVVINDVMAGGLEETARQIAEVGGKSTSFKGDVSKTADVKAMIALAEKTYGGLDILHANAGVERYENLEIMKDEDMEFLLDVDLKGVLICFREAIPALRKRGGGSLIASFTE